MTKPIIGITPSFSDTENEYRLRTFYAEALYQWGAVPVILPYNIKPDELKFLNGILFSGGGDIDPSYFQEEPLPGCGEITPERDCFEIPLCQFALKNNLPVLGICRGIQIIAVASGGSIYQDMACLGNSIIKHMQSASRRHPTHFIQIKKDTLLHRILGCETCRVNSFHHQAVSRPGDTFVVSAKSKDGVIEAIEDPLHPFALGVQWHPECLYTYDKLQNRLFQEFVKHCCKI